MSEFASIIANSGLHQQLPNSQTLKTPKENGQASFQEVLENGGSQLQNQTPSSQNIQTQSSVSSVSQTQPNTGVSGVKLDAKLGELQNNLQQKYGELGTNPNPSSKNDLLPDLFYNKSKLGLLGDALKGMNTSSPKGIELLGRFSQVEGEYKQLDVIMKSNKDLSPGELLGLQARLYQVGQHIEVMSKVVDQMAGGIKTILNTNV